MRGDARSGRVLVVPDALVNPPDGDTTAVDALVADGWGLVVLPPEGLDPADEAALLAVIDDQLAAFAQAGYAIERWEDGRCSVQEASEAAGPPEG